MTRPTTAIEYVDGQPQVALPPRLAYGPEAVLTRCAIRLWTIRGVWPDDRLLGMPWRDWLLRSTDAEIAAQARRQLRAVEGVLRVVEIRVRRDLEITLAARVRIAAATGGEVEAIVGDLGVWEGVVPGAWYQILQTTPRWIVPVPVVD